MTWWSTIRYSASVHIWIETATSKAHRWSILTYSFQVQFKCHTWLSGINREYWEMGEYTWINYPKGIRKSMHKILRWGWKVKGAQSDFFSTVCLFVCLFQTLQILVSQESSYLYNPCEILQLKSVLFGRYDENIPGYGNHNWAYRVRYRQLQYTKCFVHPKGLTISIRILNLYFWSDDSSN